MSEMTLTLFASARGLDSTMVPWRESVTSSTRLGTSIGESCHPSGATSLSMMRQAFDGLLAQGHPSLSSPSDCKNPRESSIDGGEDVLHRPANAFREEICSFDAVCASDGDAEIVALRAIQQVDPSPRGATCVESVEFFNYLTAIGAL